MFDEKPLLKTNKKIWLTSFVSSIWKKLITPEMKSDVEEKCL